MAKFSDECWDSADWIEEVTGHRPVDDVITLAELNKLAEDKEKNGGWDGLPNRWDYPLSETPYLVKDEDEEEDREYVLVRFAHPYGGYEYRWCEI